MDKKLNGNYNKLIKKIETFSCLGIIPQKYLQIFRAFLDSYQKVIIEHKDNPENHMAIFDTFVDLVKEFFQKPFVFALYHEKIRTPFDYYKFGIDFLRPLVDLPRSTLSGTNHLDMMESFLEKKENVILFANHQIEADPQAISILLEKRYSKFAEELIFVAGMRVISDPLAIPFSMGRNLLCIHSKKYIDHPPEEKHQKQMHNKRTMERMVELLAEGGYAIYVAPSGGRDRANENGIVEVSPFDPQSIEMFYLMAQKGKTRTHFFPLSLSTYHLLPPPETTEVELGEIRLTRGGAIHLHFGKEVDMENFPRVEEGEGKKDKRRLRAEYLWNCVKREYEKFP